MSLSIKRVLFALTLGLVFFLQACGGGGSSSPPPPGTLTIAVTTVTPATALAGVTVLVFNADTNAPAASGVTAASTGKFSASLAAGNYYVKLSKQGYSPVPASALLTPVPHAVSSGLTTNYTVNMSTSTVSNTGWISGKVSLAGSGLGNVLVAAEAAGVAYTSISDSAGNYAIYNVPAAGYTVKAYAGGYTFASQSATVTAAAATTTNLAAAANAGSSVPVTFNRIAGGPSPASMLISLVHPVTKETIPGQSLSQPFSPSLSYNFSGVADGNYIVRATFANDGLVVDPDYIMKFGEPNVAVTAGTPTPNPVQITSTGAVELSSPTNAMSSTQPVIVAGTTTPTFTWAAYSSTSDYVIEVMDADTGTVIWGGFTGMGTAAPSKNIVIPPSQTSITYNSDGKASAPLMAGKTYRWRIYASKDDTSALGWHLISMSEDQMGLIQLQ